MLRLEAALGPLTAALGREGLWGCKEGTHELATRFHRSTSSCWRSVGLEDKLDPNKECAHELRLTRST